MGARVFQIFYDRNLKQTSPSLSWIFRKQSFGTNKTKLRDKVQGFYLTK